MDVPHVFADERLHRLAVQSFNFDTVIVEMIYCDRVVQFDMPVSSVKYVPPSEMFERYWKKAFAAIHVPIEADVGETDASALSSSSQPNV